MNVCETCTREKVMIGLVGWFGDEGFRRVSGLDCGDFVNERHRGLW
jgi:hypothetical protein